MKKILFVANVSKEHILKFHIPTIKMLKEAGWQVDVACAGDEIVPYCDKQYRMSWKRSPFSYKLFVGILELKKIIDSNSYDVIYCHTPVGGLAARLAGIKARKRGTKVIYFAHGFHFYAGASKLNWMIYYPIEKWMARYTDAIITINQEDYENAKNRLGVKKVYLIPGMGIDLNEFCVPNKEKIKREYKANLGIPEDAYVLVYLAEIIPNKNQKLIVDALKIVHEKYPNTHLVLAGIDHTNGKFSEYVKKNAMEQFVHCIGWRDDKANLYAMADLCVASSIREGFGLNIVEAMASGLKVVATDNRGHRSIIVSDEIGYLVPNNNPLEFADRIILCMTQNSNVSLDEILRYSQNNILEKIYSIIQDNTEGRF